MPPRCVKGTNGSRVIAYLKEMAETFAVRSPIDRVLRVVDVNLEFGREEIREACFGEIQYGARTSDEVNGVVN